MAFADCYRSIMALRPGSPGLPVAGATLRVMNLRSRTLAAPLAIVFAAGTLALAGCSSDTGGAVASATAKASSAASAAQGAASAAASSAGEAAESAASEVAEGASSAAAAASGAVSSASAAASAAVGGNGAYTMAQVQAHKTSGDCWVAVDGKVYDLTNWEAKHPGGADRITALCGTDGTAAFQAQHAGQGEPNETLAEYQIGTLAG